MINENVPGTLTLANQLASGITAESVAVAETSIATNQLEANMTGYAQDQYTQGQKMAPLVTAMQITQYVLIGAALALGGIGLFAANSGSMMGQMATYIVKAPVEFVQGASALATGGMQARKSSLQASIEIDTTGANVDEKLSGSNGDAMKTLSQGESKVGSSIVQMVQSAGSIMSEKIT
jgi:hypothetical protein